MLAHRKKKVFGKFLMRPLLIEVRFVAVVVDRKAVGSQASQLAAKFPIDRTEI